MITLKHLILTALLMMVFGCKNETKKSEKATVPQQNYFTINGTAKNVKDDYFYLYYEKPNGGEEDTIVIKNGKFNFKGIIKYPSEARIAAYSNPNKATDFFLEDTDYTITIDTTNTTNVFDIKGAALQDEYVKYLKFVEGPFDDELDDLFDKSDIITDEVELAKIEQKVNTIYKQMADNQAQYLKDHPSSFISASIIEGMLSDPTDIDKIETAYNKLDKEVMESFIGKKLAQTLADVKVSAVGQTGANLVVNDTEGNPIKLYDQIEKYTLVEFWASWCGPCRKENPALKKVYDEYKDKGFEVYAVSIDTDKEAWLQAIKEDDLPWIHVSDLKAKNEAAKSYAVQAVPMSFLLDKEGKIVATGLQGEALAKKLEELL